MKMIQTHIPCSVLSLGLLASAFGGEDTPYIPQDIPEVPVPSPGEPDALKWLTLSADIRARYEFREIDGLDAANLSLIHI